MDRKNEIQIEILDSMMDLFRELGMKESTESLFQAKKYLIGLNSKLYDTVGQCSMDGKCFNKPEDEDECCMNPACDVSNKTNKLEKEAFKRKIEEIDQSKILDNSNKMLAEAMEKYSDKISDSTKKMITRAMDENNTRKGWFNKKMNDKKYIKMPYDELNTEDYTFTHTFYISVECDNSTYSFDGRQITYFNNEDITNNIHIGLLEKTNNGFILPEFLDNAMFNKDSFTIKKRIYDRGNNLLYTIVYNGCRIVKYRDPGLDYNVTELRVFDIEFDYSDYHYEKQ